VPAHFLNADLDIFSDQDLQLLIDEIGDRAVLLHGGPFIDDLPFVARYEIDHDPDTKTPESLILAFCELVEGLSPASRAIWDSARERVIDLGYEVWRSRDRTADRVSSCILSRTAALSIDLAWTFYPSDEEGLSPRLHD
jgi:hypothetical protein